MTALEEVLSRLDLPEDTQDLLEQTDFDDAKSVTAVIPSAWKNVLAWLSGKFCLYCDKAPPAASALAQAESWCQCCDMTVQCHLRFHLMLSADPPHPAQSFAWPLRLTL